MFRIAFTLNDAPLDADNDATSAHRVACEDEQGARIVYNALATAALAMRDIRLTDAAGAVLMQYPAA